MGLLDDLLAGLGDEGTAGRSTRQRQDRSQEQPAGGSTAAIIKALLPMVLALLANRGGSEPQVGVGQRPARPGGGLDDLFGAIFGSARGGLGDLLSQLQRAGLGEQAQSWVGRGQNLPVSPEAMEQVFGRGGLEEIARRAGVTEADASRVLSQLLPEVVDQVTPDGRVPDADALTASVDALSRRYGLS